MMSREKQLFRHNYSCESVLSDVSLTLQSSTSDLDSSSDLNPISPYKPFPTVIGILLDMLEKRIPPLNKLSIGRRDKTQEEINALSLNLKRNAAVFLSFGMQSLTEHSTGVIFEVLRCYLEQNFPALFQPTLNFCKLSIIFHHNIDILENDKRIYATEELHKIIQRIPSRRVSLLSLIMRRFHMWVKEEIAYQLRNNAKKTPEELKREAFSFLTDIFTSTLVRISERREVAILLNGIKFDEIEIFTSANVYALKDFESEMAKYEAENQLPLNPKDFLNATDYMLAKERQDHYAAVFANLRLARENAKRDREKAEAMEHDLNSNDWEFDNEKPLKPILSQDKIVEDELEIDYTPRECKLTCVKIVDQDGQHMDNISLDKPLDWCSLYTLMTVISIDFWHKTALELAKTQQQKEKMRRGRNGSWRAQRT